MKKKLLFIYPVEGKFYIYMALASAFSLKYFSKTLDFDIFFLLANEKDEQSFLRISRLLNCRFKFLVNKFILEKSFPRISYKTFALKYFLETKSGSELIENYQYISIIDADTVFKKDIDFLDQILAPDFVLAQIVTPLDSFDYINNKKFSINDIGKSTVISAFNANVIDFNCFPSYRVNAGFYIISSLKIKSVLSTWYDYLKEMPAGKIKLSEALFSFAIEKNNMRVAVFYKDIINKYFLNKKKFNEYFSNMTFSKANQRLNDIARQKDVKDKNIIALPVLINNQNHLRASLIHFMSGQKFKLIMFICKQRIYSFEYKILLICNYYFFILKKFLNKLFRVIIKIL